MGGGTAGLSSQVYTCVKNCGAAEYIPGTNAELGTWIVTAPVYGWISTGTHWYVKDGRFVLNPYFEKSKYSDAFDTATAILFTGPITVIAGVEAAGTLGVARVTAHGAARLAGPGATRGGVLSYTEALATRFVSSAKYTAANGASVYVRAIEGGKFNVAMWGRNGFITSYRHVSAKTLSRLGKSGGWQ
jgi:hypothetical protein